MLGLKLPTDPRWADLAAWSLEDILADHAFCEQKAASQCISLVQQYPDREELVQELSAVVTEEWGHFRQVWSEMQQRGWKLGHQRPDAYVNTLQAFVQQGGDPQGRFLDRLLLAGLIEARSCERFRLLAEGLTDPDWSRFYRKFMESEAGHYHLFLRLARTYLPADRVRTRWVQWLERESQVIREMPLRLGRIH